MGNPRLLLFLFLIETLALSFLLLLTDSQLKQSRAEITILQSELYKCQQLKSIKKQIVLKNKTRKAEAFK